MALTQRQARFVQEYHLCHNGARAAVAAGYAPGSAKVAASRLLTLDNVQAVLAQRQQQAAAEFNVTRQRVLHGLLEAIGEGRQLGNPMAQIRGWSEIAKMLGFYAPEQKEVKLSIKGAALQAKYEAMSDEQLLLIAAVEPE
jgi:phage terminase small subunit